MLVACRRSPDLQIIGRTLTRNGYCVNRRAPQAGEGAGGAQRKWSARRKSQAYARLFGAPPDARLRGRADIVQYILLALVSLLWGTSFILVKIAAPSFDPTSIAAIRVLVAAAVLLPVVLVPRSLPPLERVPWRGLAALSVLGQILPFVMLGVDDKCRHGLDDGGCSARHARFGSLRPSSLGVDYKRWDWSRHRFPRSSDDAGPECGGTRNK